MSGGADGEVAMEIEDSQVGCVGCTAGEGGRAGKFLAGLREATITLVNIP